VLRVVLVLRFICCGRRQGATKSSRQALPVSMIRLLANPEKYHGKRVIVEGYMRLEFEGDAIYFHEEDYKKGLSSNSFWLDVSVEQLKKYRRINNQYVFIEGVFDAKHFGHMGMFSGEIKRISRIQQIRSHIAPEKHPL
jgi:hypothetical protein